MSRRTRFGLGVAVMSVAAAVGPQAVLAAAAHHLKPANKTVKIALKAGTETTFTDKLGPLTVTQLCTSSTDSFKTPAHGLGPVKLATPRFTGCTDSLGGIVTVTTHGKWTEKFLSAKRIRLTIPKAGAMVVSSLAPTCVITVAPSGPAVITATYDNVRTTRFKNASLPTSTSAGCTRAGTAKFSATYIATRRVKVVS